MHLKKKCVFCYFLIECSINMNSVNLMDNNFKVYYNLADSLFYQFEKDIKISDYICEFVYFYQFLLSDF